jgi:subtilisin family serine protease
MALCLLTPAAPAMAQLGGLGLPGLPELGRLPVDLPSRLPAIDTRLAPPDLRGLRQALIIERLRRHPDVLDRDPAGALILRQQLLAAPSTPVARTAVLAGPVQLLDEPVLDGLDLRWLLLRPHPGVPLARLLAQWRQADPDGFYDYQHIYLGSGVVAQAATPPAGPSAVLLGTDHGLRVGLVDSGVDDQHPALRAARVLRHGCDGTPHPAAHGTAVASLLVGRANHFAGALPGGQLFAADIYCDAADGGSVLALTQALAWLAREQVGVINISLVGPPNALLQRAVAALQARGHLVVAAVGNDGPAAPPLYPASWPGVVGVTGVDTRRRVLVEAGRGPQVMLAAPGADTAAAAQGSADYLPVRGTSFAAPLVAGLLARRLPRPDPAGATQALAALVGEARDLGSPGRDDTYGRGLVGEALRSDPGDLPLARPARR